MRHMILRTLLTAILAFSVCTINHQELSYAFDENIDYEEEKSDIEDAMYERDEEDADLENEYNDVQDEQDNVNNR